jgi:hypothetical protein
MSSRKRIRAFAGSTRRLALHALIAHCFNCASILSSNIEAERHSRAVCIVQHCETHHISSSFTDSSQLGHYGHRCQQSCLSSAMLSESGRPYPQNKRKAASALHCCIVRVEIALDFLPLALFRVRGVDAGARRRIWRRSTFELSQRLTSRSLHPSRASRPDCLRWAGMGTRSVRRRCTSTTRRAYSNNRTFRSSANSIARAGQVDWARRLLVQASVRGSAIVGL